MTTDRRRRIDLYVGPRGTTDRDGLAALDASGEWVFDEKKDGYWCLAQVVRGKVTAMVSRTGLPFAAADTAGLFGLRPLGPKGSQSGRVVGELVAEASKRRLYLFDVLEWNGLDLRDLPQTDRREALEMIYEKELACDEIRLVEYRTGGAREFFDRVIAAGGEGVVAKRRDAKLRAQTGDGKIDSWIRAKKKRCVDYIVLGLGEAQKGTPNVRLGLWVGGKLVEVLTCVLPPEWRKFPASALVGEVVEAAGWEVWDNGVLRSAQLGHRAGPRSDKKPEECTLEAALEAR